MPIDMSTEATTRVDDQKRQKQEEADFECTLEFRNHEGRHQYPQRQVLALGRFGFFGHVGEKFEILVTHILLHECAQGLRPAFKRLLGGYLFATSGLIPVAGALQCRPHHGCRQKEGQRYDHRIGRSSRGAERGAQQRWQPRSA
jgi:hypothetical protein